jgi:hypothetical protein
MHIYSSIKDMVVITMLLTLSLNRLPPLLLMGFPLQFLLHSVFDFELSYNFLMPAIA